MMLLLGVTAVAIAVAVTYTTTGSAATPTTWTTERYIAKETWHAFADVGTQDNGGPDDIYAAQQSVTTPNGQPAGMVNGYGINLRPPYTFFHWTATLRRGTLTIASAVNLSASPAVYPIEGGTGAYSGVRGTVTVSDNGANGALVTVRYQH
jgi:hypothetical protein